MAAGAKVCHYRDEWARSSSLPVSFPQHSACRRNFLRTSSLQQHYWRVSYCPPSTTRCYFASDLVASEQPLNKLSCEPQLILPPPQVNRTVRHSVFGSPLQPNALRSCGVIQVHLNRMLFSGLRVSFSPLNLVNCCLYAQKLKAEKKLDMSNPPCSAPHREALQADFKEKVEVKDQTMTQEQEKGAFPTQPPVIVKVGGHEARSMENCSPVKLDDEMAGNPDFIHSLQQQSHPDTGTTSKKETLASDNEYEDSDNESDQDDLDSEDEYGYETDTCEEEEEGDEGEEFIEFSDECSTPDLTPHPPTAAETDQPSSTLTPNERSYLSLYSEESGFCENGSDSPHISWSEDEESDTECVNDTKLCDDIWNCFQSQALSCSPQLSCKKPHKETVERTLRTHMSIHESSSEDDCLERPKTPPPSPNRSRKHVTFKPDPELAVVHHMVAWNFAYRACRKGPWEQFARDRGHFKRRIESVANVLEPCLKKKLSCCPIDIS